MAKVSSWDDSAREVRPKERTPEILATFDSVLARDPENERALMPLASVLAP